MHELGIVFHIINEIEDVGKENELKTVSSVTVEIGEVSGVLHDYLEDCWKWACSKSELMNGAELKVEGTLFAAGQQQKAFHFHQMRRHFNEGAGGLGVRVSLLHGAGVLVDQLQDGDIMQVHFMFGHQSQQ